MAAWEEGYIVDIGVMPQEAVRAPPRPHVPHSHCAITRPAGKHIRVAWLQVYTARGGEAYHEQGWA